MVFNGAALMDVVGWALDVCQVLACNPEFLQRSEVLDLLCCVPFRLMARIVRSFVIYIQASGDDDEIIHLD